MHAKGEEQKKNTGKKFKVKQLEIFLSFMAEIYIGT